MGRQTNQGCVVGFKEMLDVPNLRRSGKKHGKHSTSLTSSFNEAGTPRLTVPVIVTAAPGSSLNHRDVSSGLSGGHKASKIRRALAKLNLLPFNNRY